MLVLNACLIIIVFVATLFMVMWCPFHYKFPAYIQEAFVFAGMSFEIFIVFCAVPTLAPYAIVSLISSLANVIFASVMKLEVDNIIHFTRFKIEKTVFLVMWAFFAFIFIISVICCSIAWVERQ